MINHVVFSVIQRWGLKDCCFDFFSLSDTRIHVLGKQGKFTLRSGIIFSALFSLHLHESPDLLKEQTRGRKNRNQQGVGQNWAVENRKIYKFRNGCKKLKSRIYSFKTVLIARIYIIIDFLNFLYSEITLK